MKANRRLSSPDKFSECRAMYETKYKNQSFANKHPFRIKLLTLLVISLLTWSSEGFFPGAGAILYFFR